MLAFIFITGGLAALLLIALIIVAALNEKSENHDLTTGIGILCVFMIFSFMSHLIPAVAGNQEYRNVTYIASVERDQGVSGSFAYSMDYLNSLKDASKDWKSEANSMIFASSGRHAIDSLFDAVHSDKARKAVKATMAYLRELVGEKKS